MPIESKKGATAGVYNVDYYSGSQVALYIGDTWVDEVTSLSYIVRQDRKPIYDYANPLFRDMSKGPVLVQGEFTINFKEAGYLWLILDRYQTLMNDRESKIPIPFGSKDEGKNSVSRNNIERIINADDTSVFNRNKTLQDLAKTMDSDEAAQQYGLTEGAASLGGFSSNTRASGGIGDAENAFEVFEDKIWKLDDVALNELDRRADDPDLNPFDIYIAYGDFAGDDKVNHTIRKLDQVHIVGTAQQIVIDGQPIQEAYSFIARNVI
jgi:hypothetical protein